MLCCKIEEVVSFSSVLKVSEAVGVTMELENAPYCVCRCETHYTHQYTLQVISEEERCLSPQVTCRPRHDGGGPGQF